MAYLDHIALCNTCNPERFRPFVAGGERVGWVRDDMAPRLARFPDVLEVTPAGVVLNPALATPQARAEALDAVVARLAERGDGPLPRGERYGVVSRWGRPAVTTLDRAVVSLFGVRAFGVHLNGFVRRSEELSLWIGRRAPDKAVAPGKLDNMVAGGQPAHLGLLDNLVKEAAEEADLPAALARAARPVGAITYRMEDAWGMKPDTLFCWDLEVAETFTPHNTDGEMAGFTLMPVERVAELVRDTDTFKFNVPLVILDFLIRHGVLCPDSEPDYAEIAHGLKQGL